MIAGVPFAACFIAVEQIGVRIVSGRARMNEPAENHDRRNTKRSSRMMKPAFRQDGEFRSDKGCGRKPK